MKKNFWKLAMLSFVTVLSLSAVSCGDDGDDNPSSSSGNDNGVTPPTGTVLTPTQQKQYMEKVAQEFMNITKASDFQAYAEFGKYVNNTYVKGYNWQSVGDWAKRCFDAAVPLVNHSENTETSNSSWGDYTYVYIYNYIYNDYAGLLLASQFTGHFTASNGSWSRTDADDLQFIFNDQNGNPCVLKLATSGKVTNVHIPDIRNSNYSWYSSYYNYSSTYITDRTYNTFDLTVGVPEQIEVTLSIGGGQLVKAAVKFDASNMNGSEFVFSNSNLNVSAVVSLSNGYEFNVSQVAYQASKSAAVNFTMSKSGTSLVSLAVASDVTGLPSYYLSNIDELRSKEFSNANGKNSVAKIDILGKMQLQGTVSDVRKLSEYFEAAEDNRYDEAQFKSYVNQANSLMDLILYYDNNTTKQASVKLESFAKQQSWSNNIKWKTEPVILFYDGSSYSTFSAFFNENDFNQVINSFKSLAQSYANLIDQRVKW
ncbi:MAG: hypothetical protein IJ081_03375 [Prevotella sp.]|nr:hypothetical protein [Prevotella sp.]